MEEQQGSAHVERVVLDVSAPPGNLADANSGLNLALSQLEAIRKAQDTVIARYKEMAGLARKVGGFGVPAQSTTQADSDAARKSEEIANRDASRERMRRAEDRSSGGSGSGGGSSGARSTGGGGGRAGGVISVRVTTAGDTETRQTKTAGDSLGSNVFTKREKRTEGGDFETTSITEENNVAARVRKQITDKLNREKQALNDALASAENNQSKSGRLQEQAAAYRSMEGTIRQIVEDHKEDLRVTGQIYALSKLNAQAEAARRQANRSYRNAFKAEDEDKNKLAQQMADGRERAAKAAQEAQRLQGLARENATRKAVNEARRRNEVEAALQERARAREARRSKVDSLQLTPDAERDRLRGLLGKKFEHEFRKAQKIDKDQVARQPLLERVDKLKTATTQQREFLKSLQTPILKRELFRAEDLERSGRIGKNMLDNVKHVTAWAASVGVLYGSIRLLNGALATTTELQYKQARLSAVARDPSSVGKMTSSVLALAAANGRDASEAMEAAIAWSRLGLTRVQVNEAVRVSLQAANVAEVTAGEATEHLSSLMATYQLRVSELSGVLGSLNAISNTYNVTNKDMLEGLTRTASVAKQAGIPLRELMGLIGATVGATGQTGANIGNSIKSVTGALSDANVQENLRNDFNFEVTTDGGDQLKNVSQILAELFVRYQQLSDAERRTMIFSVAGKNQASRMAAMLDNYVRAQVLAITATSNLTSAEHENALITETLQARFKGLVTEFERFAFSAGTSGPAQVLGEVAQGMRNIVALGSLPGVSTAVTALTGLFGALAIKVALVGFHAKNLTDGKRGIIGNTIAAVRRSMDDVKTLTIAAAAPKGSQVNKDVIASSGHTTALMAAQRGLVKGSDGQFYQAQKTAQGFQFVAVNADRAAKAVTLLTGAMTLIGRTLASVALPMAVIGGALWAVNKASSALNLTTDALDADMLAITQRAEQFAAAADSAATAAKLFNTISQALPVASDKGSRKRMFEGAAEAAFAPRAGAGESDRHSLDLERKKLEDRFAQLEREKNQSAQLLLLEDLRAKAILRQGEARQRQFEEWSKAEKRLREELKSIEEGFHLSSSESRKKRKEEIQQQIEGIRNRRVDTVVRDAGSFEQDLKAFRDRDERYATFLEKNQITTRALGEIHNQISTSGEVDQLNVEIALLERIKEYNDQIASSIEDQRKARQAANAADMRTAEELQAQINKHRSRVSEIDEAMSPLAAFKTVQGTGTPSVIEKEPFLTGGQLDLEKARSVAGGGGEGGQIDAARQLLILAEARAKEMEKISKLEALVTTEATTQINKREQTAMQDARTAAEEARKKLAALKEAEAVRRIAEEQVRRNAGTEIFRSEIDAMAIGDGPGERRANQARGLSTGLQMESMKAAALELSGRGGTPEHTNALLRANELGIALQRSIIDGKKELIDLEKEETNLIIQKNREYQRGLLTASPGELLRKLAVNQLTRNGTNAGSFFALSPEARQDFLNRPENSDEVRQVRRDRRALQRAGFNRPVEEIQDDVVNIQRGRRSVINQLSRNVPIDSAARDAVNALGLLKTAAASAASELLKIRAPQAPPVAVPVGAPIKTPQGAF